jgi:hypothetical protein
MLNLYTQQEEEILNRTLVEIEKRFPFEPADLPSFLPDNFELLKYYSNFLNRRTVKLKGSNTYVAFVEVEFSVKGAKGAITLVKYFQCYVFCYLARTYGRLLIRRETLADKINELFHPMELDFAEDKAFSNQFFVLASDKTKAISFLNKTFRTAAIKAADDDLFIEVADSIVLIGSKQTVDEKSTLDMVTLGFEIDESSTHQRYD